MPASPSSRALRVGAVSSLVLANLFWAGNFVLGAAAVAETDALSLVALRWGLAAIPLIVLAVVIERPRWRPVLRALPLLALLAVLGMLGYTIALYEALRFTSATNASLVNALNPALIVLVSAILLRERIGARGIVGMLLGLVGVIVVLTRGSWEVLLGLHLNVGELLMLVAIGAWTAYTILGRGLRDVSPITATAVQAVLAALIMVPIVAVTGLRLPETASGWGALAYIVLLPAIGAYLLWNLALRTIRPAVAGVFLNLLTVFVVLIGVILGEGIGLPEAIGGVLVLGGVALASVPRRAPMPTG